MIGVVGGGFWGTAIALRLNEAGVEAEVLDDADAMGASRSAAGICKLSWYRQDTVRKMMAGVFTYHDFREGFEWLRGQVAVTHTPERFVNDVLGTESEHVDNYLAIPRDLLGLGVRRAAAVRRVVERPTHVELEVADGTRLSYDQVVVAAGARTDELLRASSYGAGPTKVHGLLGRAVLFTAEAAPCVTVMTRPYRHFTYRRFGAQVRGGDTVERNRDERALSELVATAVRLYPGADEFSTIAGVRPVCPRMFVGRVGPRVLAATGGHRVGFGLAGAVSARARDLLLR